MPRKSYDTLRRKMSPERRQRNEAAAQEMLAEMVLAELRKAAGFTQVELAKILGVSQANLSQLEHQTDIQISTLRRLIEAIGGQLELVVKLPDGNKIRVTQFTESVEPAA
ncbi:MAG: helix-turn-helix transcriptional regulator [Phycisphaerae bacterium]|nr:helix-turn-helix transcriptional regulator [Phycisphaerae bacterium]